MSAAPILTYEVTYMLEGDSRTWHRRVAVGDTSNHRTTFSDIPQILAVATVGSANLDRITIVSAQLVSTEPSAL